MTGIKRLTLSGGVAANTGLRRRLEEIAEEENWELFLPPLKMCTDNAVMIASAGVDSYMRGNRSDLSLSPDPFSLLCSPPLAPERARRRRPRPPRPPSLPRFPD